VPAATFSSKIAAQSAPTRSKLYGQAVLLGSLSPPEGQLVGAIGNGDVADHPFQVAQQIAQQERVL
jgi:hypothetical protein